MNKLALDIRSWRTQPYYSEVYDRFLPWPGIAQLSFVVLGEQDQELSRAHYIIDPEDYIVPQEALQHHQLCPEQARKTGYALGYALTQLHQALTIYRPMVIVYDEGLTRQLLQHTSTSLNAGDVGEVQSVFCVQVIADWLPLLPPFDGTMEGLCQSWLSRKLIGQDSMSYTEALLELYLKLKKSVNPAVIQQHIQCHARFSS